MIVPSRKWGIRAYSPSYSATAGWPCTPNEEAHFAVTYETNLRLLDIVELYCIEQEDLTGDDDPYLNLLIDYTASSTFYYPDTDSDQGHNQPSSISGTPLKPHAIKILSNAELELMEEDDADDDDLLDSTYHKHRTER